MTTRLTIAQSERALLWRQGRFVGILEPGVRWIVQPFACVAVQLYDLRVPEFEHPRVDELLAQARATMERHFQIVELGEQEMGVVYKDGTLAGTLAPGKRQLYWKGPTDGSRGEGAGPTHVVGPGHVPRRQAQSLVFL